MNQNVTNNCFYVTKSNFLNLIIYLYYYTVAIIMTITKNETVDNWQILKDSEGDTNDATDVMICFISH